MWFTSLLSSLPARAGHRPQTARNRARHRFVPRLEVLEDRIVPSTLTVLNNLDKGAGSLRDAITKASNGDTIVFDPSLNGQTITLTSDQLTINENLDIEGPGASLLAISGNGNNRVFNIPQGNSVTIAGLTITQGLGNGIGGGGVLVAGSTLALTNDVLSDNQATFAGSSVFSLGGALHSLNGANTTVSGCTFRCNVANGQGSETGSAFGGAIYTAGNRSTLIVQNSTFIGNEAIGGDGITAKGGKGRGMAQAGAIESEGAANSSLTVTNCTFSGNMAIAGNAGSGGDTSNILLDNALGGAIHEVQTTLVVSGSTFTNNQALGGSNATVGAASSGYVGLADGGALSTQLGTATITCSTFDCNLAQGGSGNSGGGGSLSVGWGVGGAVGNFFSGSSLVASNDTFSNNRAIGGDGNGSGLLTGDGIGGGLANVSGAVATLNNCTFISNQAIGGAGGAGSKGGDGLGGALANIMGPTLTGNMLGSTLTVGACTLTGNMATGGAGAAGGNGGNGFGGGIYNDGQSNLTVTGTSITGNGATGGTAGTGGSAGQGIGGGVYFASGGVGCPDAYTLANVLGNTASASNNDVFGAFTIC
jgi:hypothetical protein